MKRMKLKFLIIACIVGIYSCTSETKPKNEEPDPPTKEIPEAPLEVGYSLSIKNFTPETLEYAASVGVDVVEASGMGNIVDKDRNFRDSDEEIIAMLTKKKRMADEAGINIWSIHMPFGDKIDLSIIDESDRREVVEMHKKLLSFLEILDPEIILFHPSYYLGLNERTMRKSQLIKSAKELDEAVQAIGATMVLENMLGPELLKDENRERPLMRTVAEVEEIFGRLPESIGLAIDMNHIDNPEDLVLAMGHKLKTVHIADGTGRAENHYFPCTGEGDNDWPAILAALEQVEYTGPFLFESALPSGDEKDYKECYQSLYEAYYKAYVLDQ